MRFVKRLLLIGIGWTLCVPPASAQSVSDVLTFLVTNQSVQTGDSWLPRAMACP